MADLNFRLACGIGDVDRLTLVYAVIILLSDITTIFVHVLVTGSVVLLVELSC